MHKHRFTATRAAAIPVCVSSGASKDSGLRQSVSRGGNCWDNAPQESFFGHMKDEIDLSDGKPFGQVKAVVDDWTDEYNDDRYQWQLAKLSPNEFYRYLILGGYPLLGKPSFDAKPAPVSLCLTCFICISFCP